MKAGDAATCVVRVRGQLDDHWADWLGMVTLKRHTGGTTTLTGTVADQAQLHGLLSGLRDMGVDLLELRVDKSEGDQLQPETPDAALRHPLHTPRLTLRAATADDADRTWTYRQRAEVNQWLTECPDAFDGYRSFVNEPDRLATTVIIELHEGLVVGDLLLRRHDAWAHTAVGAHAVVREVELGWVLDPAHYGRGYTTEAVTELLRYCFADLDVHRVTAGCFADDETSWRLMERIGMRREAHARRNALHRSGRWLDSFTYALLADDWAGSH